MDKLTLKACQYLDFEALQSQQTSNWSRASCKFFDNPNVHVPIAIVPRIEIEQLKNLQHSQLAALPFLKTWPTKQTHHRYFSIGSLHLHGQVDKILDLISIWCSLESRNTNSNMCLLDHWNILAWLPRILGTSVVDENFVLAKKHIRRLCCQLIPYDS